MTDARFELLADWVRARRPGSALAPLAGDASFRRYFRVALSDGETLVAMDAPPPRENIRPFVAVRDFLADRAVVPVIHAVDCGRGFLLLEDFGDRSIAGALADGADAAALDRAAVGALIPMQAPPVPSGFPPYDEALLRRETGLFAEWHCARALRRPLRGAARAAVARAESFLAAAMTEMPVVFVHRDYHSRNLMLPPDGRAPGMLDFQDAVLGPAVYDLASLARDAYRPADERRCEALLSLYWEAARADGRIFPSGSLDELRRDFNIASVQRGLKVLGIFCRLALRDGKTDYLSDLPTVRANTLAACAAAEAAPLRALGRALSDLPLPSGAEQWDGMKL